MEASNKRSRHEGKIYRKRSKAHIENSKRDLPSNILIFDNGGYSMKIGYSHDKKPVNLPNCIMKAKSERKRAFIADQITDCRDLSGLFYIRPHQKGYITKYDVQKNIWDYTFHKYPIDDSTVLMTQPVYNFKSVQEYTDEVFFEEYDIRRLFRATGTDYSYYNYIKEFKEADTPSIVIDSGFSFTHIVPYINGKKYAQGIVRLELGGKILTNFLKDILSYRQLHVMEETHVINQVKEDVCFMSQNFLSDLKLAKNTNDFVKNYVLPDFHNIRRGYIEETITPEIAENYQILRLNNERITIPEIMIHPSIITGFEVAGLAECIYHSIKNCPLEYQSDLSNNIVLTGGNSLFSGFRDRLEKETRIFLPCEYELNIYQPEDALNYAWLGGKTMSKDPSLKSLLVSKHQYEEEGSSYIHEKFNQYCQLKGEKPKEESKISDSFSYLKFWKDEGVDILQKEPPQPVKDPEVQFKLEGDNIEELDGKYVTLDFEIEKPPEEENVMIEVDDNEKEKEKESMMGDEMQRIRRKKILQMSTSSSPMLKSVLRPNAMSGTSMELCTFPQTSTPSSSKILTALDASQIRNLTKLAKSGQIISIQPSVVNNSLLLPKHGRITPKMYSPIFRTVSAGSVSTSNQQLQQGRGQQITQYFTLGGSNVSLSEAVIVPSAASTRNEVAPSRILNNAVIVPQNLLTGKNLTFKIFPIRPESKQQGDIAKTKMAP